MKTIFTVLLSLIFSLNFAQDKMFVHTTAPENISGDATYLDHPDLNNNPNAKFIVTHVWNPGGENFKYNPNTNGVYYDDLVSKWLIYNENGFVEMLSGVHFNVYIAGEANSFVHTSTEGTFNTELSNVYLNGNLNAIAVLTHVYNEDLDVSRIDGNFGLFYTGGFWRIYNEDNSTQIPIGSKFFVAMPGESGVVALKHTVTAENINPVFDDSSVIDHPLLNGNPNAVIVVTHNYGTMGQSDIDINEIPAVWYHNGKWNISTEEEIPMPMGTMFNMMIFDSMMTTDEVSSDLMTKAYPIPVVYQVNFESKEQIKSIAIYNLLGQEIFKSYGNSNKMNVDLSAQTSGIYIAKIQTDKGTETLKLIKK